MLIDLTFGSLTRSLSPCSDGWTLVSCLFPLHWVVLSAFSQPLSPALSLPLPFNSHLLLSHPIVLDSGCLNQLEFIKGLEKRTDISFGTMQFISWGNPRWSPSFRCPVLVEELIHTISILGQPVVVWLLRGTGGTSFLDMSGSVSVSILGGWGRRHSSTAGI